MTSQTTRIMAHLRQNQGSYVPMPELSRIGSSNGNGWCASFTRRITECRALAEKEGAAILLREEREAGQRHTFYAYQKL